jgi:hypothetical protein
MHSPPLRRSRGQTNGWCFKGAAAAPHELRVTVASDGRHIRVYTSDSRFERRDGQATSDGLLGRVIDLAKQSPRSSKASADGRHNRPHQAGGVLSIERTRSLRPRYGRFTQSWPPTRVVRLKSAAALSDELPDGAPDLGLARWTLPYEQVTATGVDVDGHNRGARRRTHRGRWSGGPVHLNGQQSIHRLISVNIAVLLCCAGRQAAGQGPEDANGSSSLRR